MTDQSRRRQQMVSRDLRGRDIVDTDVLGAMGSVPREAFVPSAQRPHAYDDRPLPIGGGQTVSQPYIVALMTQALEPTADDQVLEIGSGSGYAAAVLSCCVDRVVSVERIPELARSAEDTCRSLGYDNIDFCVGDGTLGWPDLAPYEGIVVAAAGPEIPKPLLDQLAIGGRLVMPTGGRIEQRLVRVNRVDHDEYTHDDLGGVAFVPLIGAAGW